MQYRHFSLPLPHSQQITALLFHGEREALRSYCPALLSIRSTYSPALYLYILLSLLLPWWIPAFFRTKPFFFFFCIPSFVYFSTQRFACSIPAIILSLSFPLAPLDFPFLLDHSHQHIKRLWNSHKIQTFLRSHILPAPHQLLNCFSPFLKYPSCHILALPSLLNTLLPGSVLPVYQTPFGITDNLHVAKTSNQSLVPIFNYLAAF